MLRVKRLHPDATLPTRATPGSAGLDLYACMAGEVAACGGRAAIGTGVALAIPTGHVGLVCPRSGLAFRRGVTATLGVIDSDYRGEVKVLLTNDSSLRLDVRPGDRIAQLVIVPVSMIEAAEVGELDETERVGGFGSTGR